MSYIYQELNADSAFDYAKVYGQFENVKRSEFKVLFDYMEQFAEETGDPIEFNPIAWICDFSLLDEDEALSNYDVESIEDLEDKATVLKGDGFVWVQCF